MLKTTSHPLPISNLMHGVTMRTNNVWLRCSHCGRLRLSPNVWEHAQAPAEAELVMVVCPDCADALSAHYRFGLADEVAGDQDID